MVIVCPALLGQRPAARPRPRVDDRPAQPQPGRGGQEHRRQLQHPVRQDQREELRRPAVPDHQAAVHAQVQRVLQQDVQGRHAQQHAEDQRLGRHPDVVGPHLERERRRRVLRVIVPELVVDQAGRLRPRDQAGLDRRGPGNPPARDQRHGQRYHRGAQPPPAQPVGHGREGDRREGADAAPGRGVRPADGRPGPGQPAPTAARSGPGHGPRCAAGQVRRGPLIGADQLVDLRRRTAACGGAPASPAGPTRPGGQPRRHLRPRQEITAADG